MPQDFGNNIRGEVRLRALRQCGLVDTPAEPAFDCLTRLVRRLLGVPVALMSLVDADRQFFKSAVGLPEPWASRRQTPLSYSFCQHVVATGAPLAVADARTQEALRANRAVAELGVIAYLGVPLVLPGGDVLGALCAIDRVPRAWTDEDIAMMCDLAGLAMDEVALRCPVPTSGAVPRPLSQQGPAGAPEPVRKRLLGVLERLAGEVAHDMNNVLQAASGGIRLAARRLEGDPAAAHSLLGASLEALDRGAAVTRRLLSLSGRGVLFPEPLDAATLRGELRAALAASGGPRSDPAPVPGRERGVGLMIGVPDDLPAMLADRRQLTLALAALVANAREAMPGGGTLALTACAETLDAAEAARHGLHPGAYVRLEVRDTGAGMEAEVLAQAAEPFFTTKRLGKGAGLGLAAARGFAEQSGGGLAIASAPGQGTTVALWLPRAEAAEGQDGTRPEAPRMPRHVLLVDDDPMVLRVFADQLAEAGHQVVAAGSGAEALARLDAGDEVDLVVSDLSMPGMDGLELIRQAQARRPELPAILITGHPVEAVTRPGGQQRGVTFQLMHKPVSGNYLANRIDTLLGRPGPAR